MRYEILSDGHCPLLNVVCIGYANSPRITRFGPGKREQYIIHYVLGGKGWFNGRPVSAGQGFLITPDMQEEYHPHPEDPWDFLWIIAEDPRMEELFPFYRADKSTHIFDYDFVPVVREMAERLMQGGRTIGNPFEVAEWFLSLLKHHPQRTATATGKSHEAVYLQAATAYIHTNLCRPITVAELTAFLGISQPYLFRLFSHAYGLSPKQYILRQKLTRAKELLADTAITVTEVANSVGYEDVLTFSKFFTARTGESPRHYRQRHTQ